MGLFDKRMERKPFHYPWAVEVQEDFWKTQWFPHEFSFEEDKLSFDHQLTPEERGVVKRALMAISQIEVNVKAFWGGLGQRFPHPEISNLGSTLGMNEVVHSEAYAKLLDVLGLEEEYAEALKEPVFLARIQHLTKHQTIFGANTREQNVYSLALFTALIESGCLFSQFQSILGIANKEMNLKDVRQQITYTAAEENLHTKVGLRLINTLRSEYPELFSEALNAKLNRDIQEAYEHEKRLIAWILQGFDNGVVNQTNVEDYVRLRLNKTLALAGFSPLGPVVQPERFTWMTEFIEGDILTDFFNKKDVNYTSRKGDFTANALFRRNKPGSQRLSPQ